MHVFRPMPHEVRHQVLLFIKNRQDCSDLIAPYSLKGEQLAGMRCDRFERNRDDLSGANLSGAVLPNAQLIQANCQDVMFAGANLERADGSSGDFRRANFTNVFAPYAIWRYADFRQAKFCGSVFRYSCKESYGAKFSREFFDELIQHWEIEGFDRRRAHGE